MQLVGHGHSRSGGFGPAEARGNFFEMISRRAGAAAAVLCMVAGPAAAEYPTFSVSGDARVRYERIEVDPGDDVRRERYRARLALESELADPLTLHVRFATGSGDPVSSNLNFGEGFTLDDIQLDRAYLEWRPSDAARVFAGRMKNPLYRPGGTSLSWDSDLDPDGIAAEFRGRGRHATVGVFDVADQGDERSRLFALQLGGAWQTGPGEGEVTAGAGFYDYVDVRGATPFYRGRAAGNTVDAAGNYVYDYDIVELWLEYGFMASGIPVELFGDWARNLEADRENRAWAIGVNAGKADERGGLAVAWAWHDTDADALIGIFTDSDFGGGNTDSRGHVFQLEYALTDRLVAGGTLILSEFGHFNGQPRDFDRVMLDLEFSF